MRHDFERLDFKELWTEPMAFLGLTIGIIAGLLMLLVFMLLGASQ